MRVRLHAGRRVQFKYSDDEARDDHGRFSSGGSSDASSKVYVRFGDWDKGEHSENWMAHTPEKGVSVYELDEHGNPKDPGGNPNAPVSNDEVNAFGMKNNDTAGMMHYRQGSAEQAFKNGVWDARNARAHLVIGTVVGKGQDGEPLLQHMKRVGDWVQDRDKFGYPAHPLKLAPGSSDDQERQSYINQDFTSKGEEKAYQVKYSDTEARDDHGRWTSGGTSPGTTFVAKHDFKPSEAEGHHTGRAVKAPQFPHSVTKPVDYLAAGRAKWEADHGLPAEKTNWSQVNANPVLGKEIASDYKNMPSYDKSAEPAFKALAKEIDDQYDFLTKPKSQGGLGVKVTVTDKDPYDNVDQLTKDLNDNHHISVLSTASTGGHPFFTNAQNDKFRAVHDAFAHAGSGRGFDRNGEEAAFEVHSAMMRSNAARQALATETRGQNSTLIYGQDHQFPEQKIAVLPSGEWKAPGVKRAVSYVTKAYSDSEDRDDHGRWTSGGDSGSGGRILVKDDPSKYGKMLYSGDVVSPNGAPVRGTPISADDDRIPSTVYHVTTNLPAVKNSGILLASGKGGLGGDARDQVVSMTTDPKIASQLEKDIKFEAGMQRKYGTLEPSADFSRERAITTPSGEVIKVNDDSNPRLADAYADYQKQAQSDGWKFGPPMGTSWNLHDLSNQYYSSRTFNTNLKNPLFFGNGGLRTVDPDNVGIVKIPKANLKTGSMLTDFDLDNPAGLSEIRSYGDVPLGKTSETKARIQFKYSDSEDRDDHGRWTSGGDSGDPPVAKIDSDLRPWNGNMVHDPMGAAWEAMGAPYGPGAEPENQHPEKYEPNGGFGSHLKAGETETRIDDTPGEVPHQYDVTPVAKGEGGSIGNWNKDYEPVKGEVLPTKHSDGVQRVLMKVPGSEKPLEHVYRIMSEDEYQGAKKNGYFQSDGRMNLGGDEGTVASEDSTGSFYATPGDNRIVRIQMDPEDGWKSGDDGYIKTQQKVPFSKADLVSPIIHNDRVALPGGSGSFENNFSLPHLAAKQETKARGNGRPRGAGDGVAPDPASEEDELEGGNPKPKASPKERGGWPVHTASFRAQHPEQAHRVADGDKVSRFVDGHVEVDHADGSWTSMHPRKSDNQMSVDRVWKKPPPEPEPGQPGYEPKPIPVVIAKPEKTEKNEKKMRVRWFPEEKAASEAPYYVRGVGSKFVVVNRTGKVKAKFDSKKQAEGYQRALYANVQGAAAAAQRAHDHTPKAVTHVGHKPASIHDKDWAAFDEARAKDHADHIAALKAMRSHIADGGWTVHPKTGAEPKGGYQVAVVGHALTPAPTANEFMDQGKTDEIAERVSDWAQKNQSAFTNPNMHIGGWVDPDDGKVYLEPSENIKDLQAAVKAGQDRDQKAIWDNANQREIDTGGTGGANATLTGMEEKAASGVDWDAVRHGLHLSAADKAAEGRVAHEALHSPENWWASLSDDEKAAVVRRRRR